MGARNFRPLELPVESERFNMFCGFFRSRSCSAAVSTEVTPLLLPPNDEDVLVFTGAVLDADAIVAAAGIVADGATDVSFASDCKGSKHSMFDASFSSGGALGDMTDVPESIVSADAPCNNWSDFNKASLVARSPAINEFCCFCKREFYQYHYGYLSM